MVASKDGLGALHLADQAPAQERVAALASQASYPARLRLLARVRLGAAVPMTRAERRMLEAMPHRHTHRGPFTAGPLPAGLLAGLQQDALAEGDALALIEPGVSYRQLAGIVNAVGPRQDLDPVARAEARRWSRPTGSAARDGIPAQAFPARAARVRDGPAIRMGGCASAISTWTAGLACSPSAGLLPRPPRR